MSTFVAERLLLNNVYVELAALSAQGYGGASITQDASISSPAPSDPWTVAWPTTDYQIIGAAWASVTSDPAFGGSTAVTMGNPLNLTVDQAAADIQAMNAALDAYQGPPAGIGLGTIAAWAATLAAGAGVAYGLVRWRSSR